MTAAAKYAIGIVVALPEERMAVVRQLQQRRCRSIERLPFCSGTLHDRRVLVVEGGMGMAAAERATQLLLAQEPIGLLLSAGFCGAVRPGPRVADLVLCKQLLTTTDTGVAEIALPPHNLSVARVAADLQHCGLRTWQGSFITTTSIVTKQVMAASLSAEPATPVLEMETAAVARIAAAAGLPFLGIRSISDAADEELGFSLDELTDHRMQISVPRVLLACLKKPRIIPQLARLAANSGRAGTTLGGAVSQLVRQLAAYQRPSGDQG